MIEIRILNIIGGQRALWGAEPLHVGNITNWTRGWLQGCNHFGKCHPAIRLVHFVIYVILSFKEFKTNTTARNVPCKRNTGQDNVLVRNSHTCQANQLTLCVKEQSAISKYPRSLTFTLPVGNPIPSTEPIVSDKLVSLNFRAPCLNIFE